eukprot:m.4657 g.4657  ORF g.4657 m.4657 type:complete len:71 (-) comp3550_c0_seq1:64-276(-)
MTKCKCGLEIISLMMLGVLTFVAFTQTSADIPPPTPPLPTTGLKCVVGGTKTIKTASMYWKATPGLHGAT